MVQLLHNALTNSFLTDLMGSVAIASEGPLISAATIERLGWVLAHSLWQFTLLGAIAALAMRVIKRNDSELRLGVLLSFSLVVVSLPFATWLLAAPAPQATASERLRDAPHVNVNGSGPAFEDAAVVTMAVPDDTAAETLTLDRAAHFESNTERQSVVLSAPQTKHRRRSSFDTVFADWHRWIVACWMFGVTILSLRPLLGWRSLRTLSQTGTLPPNHQIESLLERISSQLGIHRQVRVLQSRCAPGPLVYGYLQPLILLPVGLVSQMPVSQLEAILAHELAHIKRNDFITNLVQVLVETVFFYHPVVWWLSKQIRIEREHCCDELVVGTLSTPHEYGRALVAVEEQRRRKPSLSLGASDGSLLERIQRISELPKRSAEPMPFLVWGFLALSITVLMSIATPNPSGILKAQDQPVERGSPADPDAHRTDTPLVDQAASRGIEARRLYAKGSVDPTKNADSIQFQGEDDEIKHWEMVRADDPIFGSRDILSLEAVSIPKKDFGLANLVVRLTANATDQLGDVVSKTRRQADTAIGIFLDDRLVAILEERRTVTLARSYLRMRGSIEDIQRLNSYLKNSCFHTHCQSAPLPAVVAGMKVRTRLSRDEVESKQQVVIVYSWRNASKVSKHLRVDVGGTPRLERVLKPAEIAYLRVPVKIERRNLNEGRYRVFPRSTQVAQRVYLSCEVQLDLDDYEPFAVKTETPGVSFQVADTPNQASGETLDSYLGTWREALHIRSGQSITPADDVAWKITKSQIERIELSPVPPGWVLGRPTLVAETVPVKLDLHRDIDGTPHVLPAIIKRDGNRIVIALREEARVEFSQRGKYAERPTSFDSTQQNGVTLYVLEPWP